MKKHFLLSFALAGVLLNAAELAQSGDGDPSTAQLDAVTLTAAGYAQQIKDAPASVTIISKDQIENRPIRDLGDIVAEVPGVALDVAKTGQNNILVRGLGSSYTLILVDGKRVNMSKGFDSNGFDSTSGFIPPASMIDRVEVVRGPASMVHGSDAMGGVINIITKKSAEKTSASVGLETRLMEDSDRWGHSYGANAAIFTPINEQFLLNLRGKYNIGGKNQFFQRDIAGFTPSSQNPYTSHSPSGYQNHSIGGRLSYTADDKNSFYIDADYAFQRLGSLNTSAAQVTSIRDYHRYGLVLNHDGNYDIGDFNSYLQYSLTRRYKHADVGIGAKSGRVATESKRDTSAFIYATTFNKNIDLADFGALIINTGPYFMLEKLNGKRYLDAQIGRTDPAIDKSQWQMAYFIEGEYLINELVSTTAGVRYNALETYGGFINPRFFVNLYPASWLTIKAGIASGLQVPELATKYSGLYMEYPGQYDAYGNSSLEPEKTLNYELSAIAQSVIGDFTLTGFYTQFKDAISTAKYAQGANLPYGYGVCGNAECRIFANVDDAISRGVEFAFNSASIWGGNRADNGLFFDFSYAFTDTEQKSGADKGKPLNDVPKHNLASRLTYKAAKWELWGRHIAKLNTPSSNNFFAGGVDAIGEYYKDIHTVDIGASYKMRNGIVLALAINNLLDQDTVDYAVYENTNGRLSYVNRYQRMVPGRNLWLNIRADF